jgi:dephospho-CoA kinase
MTASPRAAGSPSEESPGRSPLSSPLHSPLRSRLRLGLTGNIASGKGEVARLLAGKGCAIIDADVVAHELYRLRPDLVAQIARHFGPDVQLPNGDLDRKALGERVFGNPEALAVLNSLVRPALHAEIEKRMTDETSRGNDVVLDAALIIEWGWERAFHALWLVVCPEEVRRERLQNRNGLTVEQARTRLESQMPETAKRAYADTVIENGGTLEELAARVEKAWRLLREGFVDPA